MTENNTFILLVYAFIGASSAISIVLFTWGFIMYLSRLGTERRVAGIKVMEWSVGLLITAILLVGVLRFVGWWIGGGDV